jgi:hypothetical protein
LPLVIPAKAGIQRLGFLKDKSKSFRCKQRVTFCWTAKSYQKTSFVVHVRCVRGQHVRVLSADVRSRRAVIAFARWRF